jgi:hypothetical protein
MSQPRMITKGDCTPEQWQHRTENLNKVMSVRECCDTFHIWPETVRRAIDAGCVVARQMETTGPRGFFIIERRSAYAMWGHRISEQLEKEA